VAKVLPRRQMRRRLLRQAAADFTKATASTVTSIAAQTHDQPVDLRTVVDRLLLACVIR
jgi:hypothetical protein